MSSSFGTLYRITTFGESHSKAVGVIIDGCPPRMKLSAEDIQPQLDRRKPGQSKLTTQRKEEDQVEILSGVENGITLGTPITLVVKNKDQKPKDYKSFSDIPRPSHADFTYQMKYGVRTSSGGGRASARETIASVAGGAVAEKILDKYFNVEIVAYVESVADIKSPELDLQTLSREQVDQSEIRCPDPATAEKMIAKIEQAKRDKDSVGGVIKCVCRNVPIGLGEPVYEKMEAKLAQAMLAIPATKGFEIGSGFAGTLMRGSEHNDPFVRKGDKIGTRTNFSGGVQGGITNGEPIIFRVAFKPVATIASEQKTVDFEGEEKILEAKGRHDPCVLPRAVPIVESMAAMVIADMALRQETRRFDS